MVVTFSLQASEDAIVLIEASLILLSLYYINLQDIKLNKAY